MSDASLFSRGRAYVSIIKNLVTFGLDCVLVNELFEKNHDTFAGLFLACLLVSLIFGTGMGGYILLYGKNGRDFQWERDGGWRIPGISMTGGEFKNTRFVAATLIDLACFLLEDSVAILIWCGTTDTFEPGNFLSAANSYLTMFNGGAAAICFFYIVLTGPYKGTTDEEGQCGGFVSKRTEDLFDCLLIVGFMVLLIVYLLQMMTGTVQPNGFIPGVAAPLGTPWDSTGDIAFWPNRIFPIFVIIMVLLSLGICCIILNAFLNMREGMVG